MESNIIPNRGPDLVHPGILQFQRIQPGYILLESCDVFDQVLQHLEYTVHTQRFGSISHLGGHQCHDKLGIGKAYLGFLFIFADKVIKKSDQPA